MRINTAKDLDVYKLAYELAMRVFELSKRFPPEERWALTGQIRRCSRSTCQNLREAGAKRRYEAHFISKLTDCDRENGETDTCLDFARDSEYISDLQHAELTAMCLSIGKKLGSMLRDPSSFLISHIRPPVPPTSDLRSPTSGLRPPPSDVRPPTSDL